jgi:hypothetical protein
MSVFRHQYRPNRAIILAMVLLLGNIASLSCAMASTLCSPCPDHAPVMCAEPCITAETAAIDTNTDASHSGRFISTVSFIVADQTAAVSLGEASLKSVLPHTSSPPINLRNCVFLK